jgi:hypothetical protein
LSPADLVAIDFFESYRIALWPVLIEGLRGLVLAGVFYPFYRLVAASNRRLWVLFVSLWG